MKQVLLRAAASIALLFAHATSLAATGETYSFGVLNQRSAVLTARYWNPILQYLGHKTGITFELKMGKTAPETSAMIGRGEFDFVYSNTIFTPRNATVGYTVICRQIEPAIQGQIVVPEDSPFRTLKDLDGKEVGFPSHTAFVGYAVPMNALLQAGIRVTPVFAGNQEGIMGQLRAGDVLAAGVNSQVMRDYARRENFRYRALWTSENYLNLPVAVHPRIPAKKAAAVREALIGMASDAEGLRVLAASAAVIKLPPPYGFAAAKDADYQNYRHFYKTSLLRDCDDCPQARQ